MHYERNSGSKGDDLSSIVRVDWKNEDVKMSQMRTLSQGDIDQTNFLYQCSSKLLSLSYFKPKMS